MLMMYFSKSTTIIQEVKSELQAKFKITDLGPATFFLGVEIQSMRNSVFFHRAAYIREILTSHQMLDCKTRPSPMDLGSLITLSQAWNSTESLLLSSLHAVYRNAISQLLYLITKTRPDIAVAVGVLARQVSAPAEVHWTAVKRILRYLKGTMMYELHIAPTNDQLIGHADADWGRESDRGSALSAILSARALI
jgi:Reverse transcriptase (RNA-dependent DNA polymerase)